MVLAGNKAKCLSSVNYTAKTIHPFSLMLIFPMEKTILQKRLIKKNQISLIYYHYFLKNCLSKKESIEFNVLFFLCGFCSYLNCKKLSMKTIP